MLKASFPGAFFMIIWFPTAFCLLFKMGFLIPVIFLNFAWQILKIINFIIICQDTVNGQP